MTTFLTAPDGSRWAVVPDHSVMTYKQIEAIAFSVHCCGGVAYDAYRGALHAAPEFPGETADSAHARGLREGLEMAAKWHEMQADSYEDKATYGGSHESEWSKRYNQKAENERYAATAIRALSPATQAKEQKE